MGSVISTEKAARHTVDKYSFKVLAVGGNNCNDNENPDEFQAMQIDEVSETKAPLEVDSSSMSTSSKEALIESLMKKTDDMSSNFIKLQMKLEDMEEQHKKELEALKEQAFNEGVEAGKEKSDQDNQSNVSGAMNQLGTSIATLDESAAQYEVALEGIKANLITAALDIAKEVVTIEINENAKSIASVLSSELIKELQSASKVTLKVNPNDHGAISEKVGSLKHVEVISDSAVSEGGVIAMSDAGNIDAQISKRFERVKRAALSE